jgi:hypothetical protein
MNLYNFFVQSIDIKGVRPHLHIYDSYIQYQKFYDFFIFNLSTSCLSSNGSNTEINPPLL